MANEDRRNGLLLVISGPAGSGKTTLCENMLAHYPEETFQRVVTATTREPRGQEINGIDYYFFERDTFVQLRQTGMFYEWAEVHGNFYGTPREAVDDKLNHGIDLILNIDVQGAASFREAAKADPELARRMVTVFVMPPSLDEIRKRMEGRGEDAPEVIEKRLRTAEAEIPESVHYDHEILSSSKEEDFAALQAIYQAEKARLTQETPL